MRRGHPGFRAWVKSGRIICRYCRAEAIARTAEERVAFFDAHQHQAR